MHDRKRKWIFIMIIVEIILLITAFTIHILSPLVSSEISADGMLAYVGSAVAGIGSISVAIIALWQTKQIQQENSEAQTRLEKLTSDANDISRKMLDLQEAENQPFLDLQPVRCADADEFYKAKRIEINLSNELEIYYSHGRDFISEQDEDLISVFLKNIQEKEIIRIGFTNVVIEIRDREEEILKSYDKFLVSWSVPPEAIAPHERVAMVIPLPSNIWVDNAEFSSQSECGTTVHVGITMRLTNYQATEYEEKITFSIINAMNEGMETYHIFNKNETIKRLEIHSV